jgi:2-polyprenyl-6-methoxyphenol hydroxylase-like FAD-dependent oxidoreductase
VVDAKRVCGPLRITVDPDAAVIGAGPSGCAAALALARRGARVLLIEARPHEARRLAGEWLHPSGVEVLKRLGLDSLPAASTHPAGQGFVVFPGDDTEPILLHYADGRLGLTCHHHALVTALREAAAAHPGVQLVEGVRLAAIEGQRLTLTRDGRPEAVTVVPDLIVGADGRSSFARRSLGLADDRALISYMAGTLLEDVDLPFEGFGHVILGGPGPVLVCRIGPRHVRACLDVPLERLREFQDPGAMVRAYSPVLPPQLRAAFARALGAAPVAWVANQRRPRLNFGRKGLALVGDAVGHFHPLTAAGLTLGLQDAYGLAESRGFGDYCRRRAADGAVTEALAGLLYNAFSGHDDGTRSMRQAVFETWRRAPEQCRLTMRLLSGDETDPAQLRLAFFNVLLASGCRGLRHQALAGHWRGAVRTLWGLMPWLRRFASAASL